MSFDTLGAPTGGSCVTNTGLALVEIKGVNTSAFNFNNVKYLL